MYFLGIHCFVSSHFGNLKYVGFGTDDIAISILIGISSNASFSNVLPKDPFARFKLFCVFGVFRVWKKWSSGSLYSNHSHWISLGFHQAVLRQIGYLESNSQLYTSHYLTASNTQYVWNPTNKSLENLIIIRNIRSRKYLIL